MLPPDKAGHRQAAMSARRICQHKLAQSRMPSHPTDRTTPAADVYAACVASLEAHESTDSRIYIYSIKADSEPYAFARIVNILNIANRSPHRVRLETEDGSLRIHIEVESGLAVAESIQRKISQLTEVLSVKLE
jgi:hypothetical protein